MYSNPRSIFQEKIGSILRRDTECSVLFENIFKLQHLYRLEKIESSNKEMTDEWYTLLRVYEALGPAEFAKLISIIRGRTITFPSEEEFQEAITTTLCYYYKEVERKTWDDIRNILSIPDLNTIKFGIRVRQLDQFIQSQTLRVMYGGAQNEQSES